MKNSDLLTPKELAKKYPNYGYTSRDIGYIRMTGLIEGNKTKYASLISEKSFLKFAEKNRKDKKQLDALSFTDDLLTDIVNAITFMINNAKKFQEVKETGLNFNVVRYGNVEDNYEDEEEPEYFNEELEKNIEVMDKLFKFYYDLNNKQTQLFIDELKKGFSD